MKKKYLAILTVLIPFVCSAQIVNIPDVNFKNALFAIQPSIDTNSDGEIQTSEAATIASLTVANSNISDLTGIGAFMNLLTLDCSNNNLSTINFNGLTILRNLYCASNNFTSLNVSSLGNLKILYCADNQLTSIDVTNLFNLEQLACQINQIGSLNLYSNQALTNLYCDQNPITGLDLSRNGELTLADIFNPMLQYVNIKNADLTHSMYLSPPESALETQNLQYICVNEAQADSYEIQWNQYPSLENIPVTSYCDFTPGGNYNTITGNVKYDAGNDGCDATDSARRFIKVRMIQGSNTTMVLTDNDGTYNYYAEAGTYVVKLEMEDEYFTVSPLSASVNFANDLQNSASEDFCLSATGVHNDVEITILPNNPARPGFDIAYDLIYKNKGTATVSGTIQLEFDDALMDLISVSAPTSSQEFNYLYWDYANLQPFETRIIHVAFNLNSPLDTPAVNNGDDLGFAATIFPYIGDETQNDNLFSIKQVAVGSFDPNDITCLEGDSITPEQVGGYLHYLIRFQNSGTFYAENVLVTDIIDPTKLDINTLQITNTSHPHVTRITGDKAEFIFEGINLPAEQDDEPGSHGYVAFKIKTKDNLVLGNAVANTSDIFFDFNLPITTNTALTTVSALATNQFENRTVSIHPNPVNDIVTVSAKDTITSLQLRDIQGRLIETSLQNAENIQLDLSKNKTGVYFLKVNTTNGSTIEKIIKE